METEQDIEQGLAKMKIRYGDATHTTFAYRMEDADGPFGQSYFHDEEEGAGRATLNILKDREVNKIVVFIVRYYSGKNMGRRRFEIYTNLAKKAVTMFKTKLDRLSRRSEMALSSPKHHWMISLSMNRQKTWTLMLKMPTQME